MRPSSSREEAVVIMPNAGGMRSDATPADQMTVRQRQERWLLLCLFLMFAIITVPGIRWGTPSVWNNDELVYRVNDALTYHDYGFFDRDNFDYPSLPKYAIYDVGSIVYALGESTTTYIVASRMVSVVLGGLVVVLTYLIAKEAGVRLLRLLTEWRPRALRCVDKPSWSEQHL